MNRKGALLATGRLALMLVSAGLLIHRSAGAQDTNKVQKDSPPVGVGQNQPDNGGIIPLRMLNTDIPGVFTRTNSDLTSPLLKHDRLLGPWWLWNGNRYRTIAEVPFPRRYLPTYVPAVTLWYPQYLPPGPLYRFHGEDKGLRLDRW